LPLDKINEMNLTIVHVILAYGFILSDILYPLTKYFQNDMPEN